MLFKATAQSNVLDLEGKSEILNALKKVLGNKYVAGGLIVGTMAEVIKVGNVAFDGGAIISKLLPNIKMFTGITLVGIPIGSVTMGMLGALTSGTILAQVIGAMFEIHQNPDKKGTIILKTAFGLIVLVMGMYWLGVIGADLINTSNGTFNSWMNYVPQM